MKLCGAYLGLGESLRDAGEYEQATDTFRTAATAMEKIRADFPEEYPLYVSQALEASYWGYVAATLREMGKHEEAEAIYRKALILYAKSREAIPATVSIVLQLDMEVQLARVVAEMGRFDEAEKLLHECLDQLERMIDDIVAKKQSQGLSSLTREFAVVGSILGDVHWQRGRIDDADAIYRKALLNMKHMTPEEKAWRLVDCPIAELRDQGQAIEIAEGCEKIGHDPRNWRIIGWAEYRRGNWEDARLAIKRRHVAFDGGDFLLLAMIAWRQDEKKEAQDWFAKAEDWMAKHNPKDLLLVRYRKEAARLLEIDMETPNK